MLIGNATAYQDKNRLKWCKKLALPTLYHNVDAPITEQIAINQHQIHFDASILTEAEIILVLCIDRTGNLQPSSVRYKQETKTVHEYSVKTLVEGNSGIEVDQCHRELRDMWNLQRGCRAAYSCFAIHLAN